MRTEPEAAPALPEPAPARVPPKKRRGLGRWYSFFLIVLAAGTLGASTAVGLITTYVNSLPPIERLENYDPPEGSVIYDRDKVLAIGQFSTERRRVIPIDQIPERLKQAFIAVEDERFYQHFGIDLKALVRAAVANFTRGKKSQGFSTITMQLPRNILSDQVGREKTYERKIQESLLTLQIERRYSKDQILEFYLNHIFLGFNSYGIHAAAETYFNKTPDQLSIAECATLAGIPQMPSVYNPIANPDRSRKRRDMVLGRMRELGWITAEQYDEAKAEPVNASPGKRRGNVTQSDYPYFVDGLYRDLTQNYEITRTDLNEQGMLIRSTLNAEYQKIAQEELAKGVEAVEKAWNAKKAERYELEAEEMPGGPQEGQTRLVRIVSVGEKEAQIEFEGYRGSVALPEKLPYHDPSAILKAGGRLDVKITGVDGARRTLSAELADLTPIQGSVVILGARTGEVLAMVGGADFHDAAAGGQFNRAVQGGRPAGSTVKPFFYAAALERGYGPHEVIIDEPITYPSNPLPYKPQNYEKRYFGPTTLIEGLEHSRNVVTVRLFEFLGKTRTLKKVDQFDTTPGDAGWRKKFRPELPVCLGSIDMSPIELAAAYLPFTNQGVERRPQYFKEIGYRAGHAPTPPVVPEGVILDPVTAYQEIYMLRHAVTDGTGKEAVGDVFPSPPFPPISGKTGTTDESSEAWFVGFTPDLIILTYIGFDTQRTLGPKMTGGKVAGPVWANIFKRIHLTRDDWKMSFDPPSGIETVDICAATGKRVSEVCGESGHKVYRDVPYKKGKAPLERCDGVVREPLIAPVSAFDGEARVSEETETPEPTPAEENVPRVDTESLFGDPN